VLSFRNSIGPERTDTDLGIVLSRLFRLLKHRQHGFCAALTIDWTAVVMADDCEFSSGKVSVSQSGCSCRRRGGQDKERS
jgi:hypothetical protein